MEMCDRRGREAFELDYASMDADQRAFHDSIVSGPRGRVPINLRAWMHNMPFARVAEPFGLYVSEQAAITKREKEIIVLVNARFWEAEFEWAMHERHAARAGILPDQIRAIQEGRHPEFPDQGERLSYQLAHALHVIKRVPDDIYATCLKHFGHQGVSDRIGLIGLYTMIAMTLNYYQVAAPASVSGAVS